MAEKLYPWWHKRRWHWLCHTIWQDTRTMYEVQEGRKETKFASATVLKRAVWEQQCVYCGIIRYISGNWVEIRKT